jgi:hypothetical protein
MTFDLKDAEGDDYQPGYDALVELGLSRVSAQKKLRLPYSSVMGDVPDMLGKSAREICNNLKEVSQAPRRRRSSASSSRS